MPADDKACSRCKREDEEDKLIKCTTCHQTTHYFCSKPPLKERPKVRWGRSHIQILTMFKKEVKVTFLKSLTRIRKILGCKAFYWRRASKQRK